MGRISAAACANSDGVQRRCVISFLPSHPILTSTVNVVNLYGKFLADILVKIFKRNVDNHDDMGIVDVVDGKRGLNPIARVAKGNLSKINRKQMLRYCPVTTADHHLPKDAKGKRAKNAANEATPYWQATRKQRLGTAEGVNMRIRVERIRVESVTLDVDARTVRKAMRIAEDQAKNKAQIWTLEHQDIFAEEPICEHSHAT